MGQNVLKARRQAAVRALERTKTSRKLLMNGVQPRKGRLPTRASAKKENANEARDLKSSIHPRGERLPRGAPSARKNVSDGEGSDGQKNVSDRATSCV
jgi:hypothetical protein